MPPNLTHRWVAQCARRLREHWPRVHLLELEDTAAELATMPELRELPAARAAELWLSRSYQLETAPALT